MNTPGLNTYMHNYNETLSQTYYLLQWLVVISAYTISRALHYLPQCDRRLKKRIENTLIDTKKRVEDIPVEYEHN